MIITPYTRNPWRAKAYFCFILSAWWVQSWGWYSVMGLLLTDAVINMEYAEKAKHGMKIWGTVRCPIWIASIILMAAGVAMQFLWIDWRPQYRNKELLAHAARYDSGGLSTDMDPKEPQARDDDYLLIVGFHLLLECSTFVQKMFQNPFFKYLGRRSLSKLPSHTFHSPVHIALTSHLPGYFLVQSIIIYTAGIKYYTYLSTQKGLSVEAARSVCLLVCVAAVVVGAEIFHHLVDKPSKLLARILFDWVRR